MIPLDAGNMISVSTPSSLMSVLLRKAKAFLGPACGIKPQASNAYNNTQASWTYRSRPYLLQPSSLLLYLHSLLSPSLSSLWR